MTPVDSSSQSSSAFSLVPVVRRRRRTEDRIAKKTQEFFQGTLGAGANGSSNVAAQALSFLNPKDVNSLRGASARLSNIPERILRDSRKQRKTLSIKAQDAEEILKTLSIGHPPRPRFPHLSFLDLMFETGTLDLAEVVRLCPSLKGLKLSCTEVGVRLQNIQALADLPLDDLEIHSRLQPEKYLGDLWKLSRTLQSLRVSGHSSQISDTPPFTLFRRLRTLDTSYLGMSELYFLPYLKFLTELNIEGCQEITDFSPLEELQGVKRLNVRWTGLRLQDIAKSLLRWKGTLVSLTANLSKNPEHWSVLSELTCLRELIFSGSFTNSGQETALLNAIELFPHLRALEIDGVSAAGLRRIEDEHKELQASFSGNWPKGPIHSYEIEGIPFSLKSSTEPFAASEHLEFAKTLLDHAKSQRLINKLVPPLFLCLIAIECYLLFLVKTQRGQEMR